jgi:hypothetical protein
MKSLIEQYIESQKNSWSATTQASERYRLLGVQSHLDGNPDTLWAAIQGLKPYSRATTWTRVAAFWTYLIETGQRQGPNPYQMWRKKNAKAFKNVYQQKVPEMTYAQAEALISQITDPLARQKAMDLLGAGLRYTESGTYKDGQVTGKGGKVRKVYLETAPTAYDKSYHSFLRALAKVGLKPHDLRKICLNELVDAGANPFELCEAAGWSDPKTAVSYIKARQGRVADLFKKVQRG